MDLLSGLRKGDSSRGGRAEFSWDQVKEDKDRENYLGHSLMAPVGRWQAKRDLTWYAKGKTEDALAAEEQRKEEIRQIKEAEADALSEALGFPVVRKQIDPVDQNDVKRAIRDARMGDNRNDEEIEEGRGIGFGKTGGLKGLLRAKEGSRVANSGEGLPTVNEDYRPAMRQETDAKRRRDKDVRDRHRRRSRSHGHEWKDCETRGHDREHRRRRRRSRSRDNNKRSDRGHRERHRSRSRDNKERRRSRSRDDDRRRRDKDRRRSRSPREYRHGRHNERY